MCVNKFVIKSIIAHLGGEEYREKGEVRGETKDE